MSRTFIREISIEKLTQEMVDDYTNRGFEIVYKDDSVEVWAN